MSDSLVVTSLLIVGGLLGLVVVLMFGRAVFETLAAVVRVTIETITAAFRFVGNSLLALGWYVIGVFLICAIGAGWLTYVYWLKPGSFALTKLRPPVCTELLDRQGHILDYICPFDGVRVWRELDSIANNLKVLVVMLEDDKFYEHEGLDFDEILNSIQEDLEKKKLARGGSTITQQLAKNLFLSKEKSFIRKATEVPLAMRLERELSKDQILELYLNTIEWGPGIYGVEAASRLYFDREASALTEEQAWLLALMIPNPKELNLWIRPKAHKSMLKRAQRLAARLYQEHRMSKAEARAAYARFEKFVEQWTATRPNVAQQGRRYPVRWDEDPAFRLQKVASIRRGVTGLMKKLKRSPLRTNLDRTIQSKLEKLHPASEARLHRFSNVVALMDGQRIRALVPIEKSAELEPIKGLAAREGLSAQVFPARSIPPTALWP